MTQALAVWESPAKVGDGARGAAWSTAQRNETTLTLPDGRVEGAVSVADRAARTVPARGCLARPSRKPCGPAGYGAALDMTPSATTPQSASLMMSSLGAFVRVDE